MRAGLGRNSVLAGSCAEDTSGQKALGNSLIIGPSGTGKTVVQGFLMSQSQKYNPVG
jgi:type IV secretion system protein VirB4